jgi:hypothetical protein
MKDIKRFDHLNTSYVSLAALIRFLREQKFAGSIHVLLAEYEAEVKLDAEGVASVTETDRATGIASQSEGAMERLLVHAREPGGAITLYESQPASEAKHPDETTPAAGQSIFLGPPGFTPSAAPAPDVDWDELLEAAGQVIGAIEHAVEFVGGGFEAGFRAARIELGDDYPFLDPTTHALDYANKAVTVSDLPGSRVFITGLTECLRRIVNKLAIGKERKRFRESVAVELAVAARMRPNALGEFTAHLDRIAGTRVL